jgi:hypothetical protein
MMSLLIFTSIEDIMKILSKIKKEIIMKKLFVFLIFLSLSTISYGASNNYQAEKKTSWAIQAAIVSGGNVPLSIVLYAPKYEFGIFGAGKIINNDNKTRLFMPGVFGGARYFITQSTIFVFGLDVLGKFGKDDGEKIKTYYGIGPYVSLEQILTHHIMLSVWYNPYLYEYEKKDSETTKKHNFGSGGVGLDYLFN